MPALSQMARALVVPFPGYNHQRDFHTFLVGMLMPAIRATGLSFVVLRRTAAAISKSLSLNKPALLPVHIILGYRLSAIQAMMAPLFSSTDSCHLRSTAGPCSCGTAAQLLSVDFQPLRQYHSSVITSCPACFSCPPNPGKRGLSST